MAILLRMSVMVLIGWLTIPMLSYGGDKNGASLIKIISPQNEDIVDSTFEVTYQLKKGLEAHYVHIFLDGDYQKGVTSLLKNVKAGTHEIRIKVSTDEQDSLVGWDSINIIVK
ncbi:MAG: hypothetical protein ACPGYT_12665 [Nitrospirales bacterium]